MANSSTESVNKQSKYNREELIEIEKKRARQLKNMLKQRPSTVF